MTWPDDERWELINGVAYNMSPSPSRIHQKILGSLLDHIHQYLEAKSCEVYMAPTDVYLVENESQDLKDVSSVVQPDVLVVCDPGKLIDEGIRGASDFVAEVLSPSTAAKDLEEKKALYEKHGIREYWIVKSDGSVFVYELKDGRYLPSQEYLPEVPVESRVLKGFVWPSRA